MSGIQISGPKCPDYKLSQTRQFQSTNKAQLSICMLYYVQFRSIWEDLSHYLPDLGKNKSFYVLLAEMSGFPIKNVRDPRSQDVLGPLGWVLWAQPLAP